MKIKTEYYYKQEAGRIKGEAAVSDSRLRLELAILKIVHLHDLAELRDRWRARWNETCDEYEVELEEEKRKRPLLFIKGVVSGMLLVVAVFLLGLLCI